MISFRFGYAIIKAEVRAADARKRSAAHASYFLHGTSLDSLASRLSTSYTCMLRMALFAFSLQSPPPQIRQARGVLVSQLRVRVFSPPAFPRAAVCSPSSSCESEHLGQAACLWCRARLDARSRATLGGAVSKYGRAIVGGALGVTLQRAVMGAPQSVRREKGVADGMHLRDELLLRLEAGLSCARWWWEDGRVDETMRRRINGPKGHGAMQDEVWRFAKSLRLR